MDESEPKKVTLLGCLLRYGTISLSIVLVLVPLCIIGLYIWANSLGTCIHRPAFTLLSMIEQLIPWFTLPVQSLVCSR